MKNSNACFPNATLFPEGGGVWEQDARWLLMTVSISEHLSRVTGLPVDFQFQPQTHANIRHPGCEVSEVSIKLHDSQTEPQNANATQVVLWFHCPGCECDHGIHVPQWTWNGSMEAPTFTPSLMCNRDDPKSRCHTIITDGKIQFCGDSYHALAGQTVDMPDWRGW